MSELDLNKVRANTRKETKFWITADYHLGEDRFAIMQRPFDDPKKMIDTLVKNHNAVVATDDVVIIVGDVCYQKAPQYLEHVERFNGHKILFRGNHDRVFTDSDLRKHFNHVVKEGEGMDITVGGIECHIVHYPSLAVPNKFNLVGHIHGAWKYQLNSLNVGVDCNHFAPHNLDEAVPFYFKAVCDFYDDDVWAAYNAANEEYRGKRGKPGNYFESMGLTA